MKPPDRTSGEAETLKNFVDGIFHGIVLPSCAESPVGKDFDAAINNRVGVSPMSGVSR